MKIGFIDYFLDEWHANHYVGWLNKESGGRLEVTHAYGMIDSPQGVSSEQWCRDKGIKHCRTIAETIEKCDALIILSPDHAQMHEELCALPFQSGKPVYVDKTFAPSGAAARRMADAARAGKTPWWSASALRFADEYQQVERKAIFSIHSHGPGRFENYGIHQMEPLLMLLQSPLKRVMGLSQPSVSTLLMELADGRVATLTCNEGGGDFGMNFFKGDGSQSVNIQSDFFAAFIRALCRFFETGEIPLQVSDTLDIMDALEAGCKALEHPGEWVSI